MVTDKCYPCLDMDDFEHFTQVYGSGMPECPGQYLLQLLKTEHCLKCRAIYYILKPQKDW